MSSSSEKISEQNLPLWMRQSLRGGDWGILIVLGLSLAVAWAFILQPGLPHTNASENYVYRTSDYVEAIEEGRFYPRWSPYTDMGYGAPIPHYYPPGAPYTAALLDILFTNDPVTAVRLLYTISLCLTGIMTYLFIAQQIDSASGILSTGLYITSPFVGLVNPHILGDLPSVMILALLPMFLWSIHRVMNSNRPLEIGFVAFSFAGLILIDLRGVIVGIIMAIIFTIWQYRQERNIRRVFLVIMSTLIGAGLSAFYWLPALIEQHLITWKENPVTAQPIYLSLEAILTPLRQVDLKALLPEPQFTLGLVIILIISVE